MGEAIITRTLENSDVSVVQEKGQSTTDVMSQKAVTDELDLKVDKVEGKGLSSEDFTAEDKEKLGIAVSQTRKVNSKPLSEDVILTAGDVGALPDTTTIPTKTSDLENDSEFIDNTNIVQERGTSTTKVMSQKAVSEMSAVGQNASATGSNSIAIGKNTSAAETSSMAFGYGASAKEYGIAMGHQASTIGSKSVAIGYQASAGGIGVSIGNSADATGATGVAVGNWSEATGAFSTGIGGLSKATAYRSAAFGYASKANAEGSVALGESSVADETYVVSVGSGTNSVPTTRKIVNVKDPTNSQDAATKNYVDTKIINISTSLGKLLYPVGSIYMSVNSTSPKSLFGGTWEQIKDRFLLSVGSNYTAGNTGGEATHKLTSDEMPSHSHKINDTTERRWSTSEGGWANFRCGSSSVTGGDIYTQNTGSGNAHNNMPPYLVVYMWKRTA